MVDFQIALWSGESDDFVFGRQFALSITNWLIGFFVFSQFWRVVRFDVFININIFVTLYKISGWCPTKLIKFDIAGAHRFWRRLDDSFLFLGNITLPRTHFLYLDFGVQLFSVGRFLRRSFPAGTLHLASSACVHTVKAGFHLQIRRLHSISTVSR